MSHKKINFFLVVRCEDKLQGVSFCVITDRAVFFDSKNSDLEEGSTIKFEYPEDDEYFLSEDERKRKRGKPKKTLKKKEYSGILIRKCTNQDAAFEEMNLALKRYEKAIPESSKSRQGIKKHPDSNDPEEELSLTVNQSGKSGLESLKSRQRFGKKST